MKRNIVIRAICLLSALSLALAATGCGNAQNKKDTDPKNDPKTDVEITPQMKADAANITDFSVRLFKRSAKGGENSLVSPLSVLCALAMTANGAKEETLSQMENVFGIKIDGLNDYLKILVASLPKEEKCKLSVAESIWLTDDERFSVNEDFISKVREIYDAQIEKVPFNDETLKAINGWVEEKTDGMIKDILDKISGDAVMYLVNALAFDAEWREIYEETSVREGTFKLADGTEKKVDFMYSSENAYFEDENATGFMKNYKGGRFAFVGLLPKEGVSLDEYVASLDGAKLSAMLSSPESTTVYAAIPKLETGYKLELKDVLRDMGMPDAFDFMKADFSGLGSSTGGNIFIGRVIHKTFITVDERGTKAGAATVVEMRDGAAFVEEYKEVCLDRPFAYILYDREANIPLFIGTMHDAAK